MGLLKNIAVSVCVLSLVYCIMMLLTPDRFKRQMKSVISIITAVTMGGLIISGSSGEDIFSSINIPSIGESQSSNAAVMRELEVRLSEQIQRLMEESGIPVEKIDVSVDIDGDNCIFISKLAAQISGSQKLYEEKVRSLVKSDIGDVNLEIAFTEESDGP